MRVFLRGNLLTLDGEDGRRRDGGARRSTSSRRSPPAAMRSTSRAARGRSACSTATARRPQVLDDVIWRHRATRVVPRTVGQKRYVDSIRANTITFGIGPAGTGKTFLAVALAAAALSRKEVNRIILTRPAVEAGERLGFLPGDLMAKIDPYLRPLFDALHDMIDPEKVSQHLERGVIEVAPLAFMRGRTLNDSFVILDEAQNTTPEQMKMFLTRLGFGSKMVVTGDVTQVDLPARAAVRARRRQRHPRRRRGRALRPPGRRRRGPPPARAAHRRGLRGARAARRARDRRRQARAHGVTLELEIVGAGAAAAGRRSSASRRSRSPAPGSPTATSRSSSSTRARIRELNREHRAKDEPTDVLSFPIDGAEPRSPGPRELGDVVICPEHTADLREAVVHGVLHLSAWTTRPTTARCSRSSASC